MGSRTQESLRHSEYACVSGRLEAAAWRRRAEGEELTARGALPAKIGASLGFG